MQSFWQTSRVILLSLYAGAVLCFGLTQNIWLQAAGQGVVNRAVIVSAATSATTVAPESIAAIYGVSLATGFGEATPGQPLPLQLGGTSVTIDGKPAPLFFVSPNQVNCLVPAGIESGTRVLEVRAGNGVVSRGEAQIRLVSPGLLTANATGKGIAAAVVLRAKNNGAQSTELVARFDQATQQFFTLPIDLGITDDRLFLICFGTGIRNFRTLPVTARIGGTDARVDFVGPQGLAGLDQINIEIPRSLSGRGNVNVTVAIGDLVLSNEVQVEIGGFFGATGAPRINRLETQDVSVGDVITVTGSNFSSGSTKNIVRVGGVEASVLDATSGQVRIHVPYGVATDTVSVLNERNEEGRSNEPLRIRTSLSGFIEDTRKQPLQAVRVSVRGTNLQTTTDAEGLFSFKNLPDLGRSVEIELDPTTATQPGALPFPKLTLKKNFRTGRDNYLDHIPLQQESSLNVTVGSPSGGTGEAAAIEQSGFARQISTGGVIFEIQAGTPVQFPVDANSSKITMTIVADNRTPIALPPTEFTSSVVQLTPFTATLLRGAKLSFPNPENLPPGTPAKLYRLSNELGETSFVEETMAQAQVSADGQRIETTAEAIKTTSYYFVSAPRRTTTIVGQVVDTDERTPVRGALVVSRGQTALTDGDGAFVLRQVLVNDSDFVAVDAGYLRPSGRVARGQISNVPALVNGLTKLPRPIVLTSEDNSRKPIVLAPPSLVINEGETREVFLLVAHPDGGVVNLNVSGVPFASVSRVSSDFYNLRLTPRAGDRNPNYRLLLIATDDRGQTVTYEIELAVNGRPRALQQTISTAPSQSRSFVLSGEDPEGLALEYKIAQLPARGRLACNGSACTYTPNADFTVGTDSLRFKVNDALVDSEEATVTIFVTPVNQPPVLTVPGPQTVNVGVPLNFTITANDPDANQTLTFAATGRPGGSSFQQTSNTTAQFSWTPNSGQGDVYTVTFEVTDNGSPSPLKDSKTVTITVGTTGNRAPSAIPQSLSTNEDTPLNLTLSGSDPENQPLTYRIVTSPANGSLTGNGANRLYTPNLNFNGTDSFTFNVNDGALDSNTATVIITVNPINDAPVLTVPGPQSVTAGQSLTFTVSATDVDAGQNLTFSATDLPSGGSFTPATRQFTWTPTAGQVGSYTVTFRATDNGTPLLSDSKTVSIMVNASANPVPALTSLNPSSTQVGGGAFTLTVNGSGFINASSLRWNGQDRLTNFINSTQLTAQISASDIANAGTTSVTVFNPTPGGGITAPISFTVSNPSPSLTNLTPNTVTASSSAFSLIVTGSGFVGSTTVRWNGGNRTTTFVSATQLSAQITAADVANAGTAQITVFTPTPGGGSSNTLNFTINAACSYSIQPTSQTFSASGGTGTVNVSTAAGCSWTATSNANWLTITSGVSGSGLGTVGYAVAANTSTAQRSGTLTIAGQSFTVTQAPTNTLSIVSAASYRAGELAVDSQGLILGTAFTTTTVEAATNPLPTSLGGATVRIRDSGGTERLAGLFGVSPTKIRFHLASGTALGTATITVTSGDGSVAVGTTQIVSIAPGLFTADGGVKSFTTTASGQGVAHALVLRVKADGSQSFESAYRFDTALNAHVAVPIDLGAATDQVFLIFFGTGLRGRSSLSAISNQIGGLTNEVFFAGAQGELPGLDQVNVQLSRSLAGRGLVDVVLTVDGKTSNAVQINIGGSSNPVPALTSLAPSSATEGSSAFTLTVTGSNFVNGAVVRWDGSNRPTTFVSANQLTAQITAADLVGAGTSQVTVFNPAPGGGSSAALNFTINAACSYAIQSTSQTFNANGGTGTVSVTAGTGCTWTATSGASWLTITSGASGSGNGTVAYTVAANSNSTQRTGTLTIAGRTFTITQNGASTSSAVCVSAASFGTNNGFAAESVAACFGTNLATGIQASNNTPLPTTLLGTTVSIRDSANITRLAPLFFVSSGQVNIQIPAGIAIGAATFTITSGSGSLSSGTLTIATVAPGMFSANANGQGIAFGQALRVKPDGSQLREPISQFDAATNRFNAVPINLGPPTDQVFLLLRGTGLRNRSSLSAVSVQIGSVSLTPTFVGAATEAPYATGVGVGEDQITVRLPLTLASGNPVNVVVTVDGKTANTVQIALTNPGTDPVRVTSINFDQTIDGELTTSDQFQVDGTGRTFFFDAYRFTTMQTNTTVAIDLRIRGITTLDPAILLYRISNGQLILAGEDDQTGGIGNGKIENNNALMLSVLPTMGDYVIFASSSNTQPNGTGTYTLRLRQNVLQQLSYGTPLNNTAIMNSDLQTSAGVYLDAYWFTADANDQINLTMNSSAFDSFLILQNNSGGPFISSDDNSGGGSNARITRQLGNSGIYIILATPYEPNRIGAYSLSLTRQTSLPDESGQRSAPKLLPVRNGRAMLVQ